MSRLARARFLSLLIIIACCILKAAADPLPKVSPGSAGFSAERLQRIDTHMNEAVADGLMVGGQGVIARDGKIVYRALWGDQDREAAVATQQDALYRIYSMSKPVTSVALMMLYEEGRFLLNDPIARYLPEFENLSLASDLGDKGPGELLQPTRQPTIRDLMRHSAGFTYAVFGDTSVDRAYRDAGLLEQPTLADFARTLGTLPLQYAPGERWHYSVAVDVQGRLVEVLSGMSFGEFLEQRIFQPLGMNDTHFVVPKNKLNRLAQLYSPLGTDISWNTPWAFNGETRLEVADPELSRNYVEGNLFESGGAGLVSTLDNYVRFSLMLLNGGELNGVRLLSPLSVRHMHRDHIASLNQNGLYRAEGFGLGFSISLDPGESGELGAEGSYGWGGAAGTNFWVDPTYNIVGVFMTQSMPHETQLSEKFRILTYQALTETRRTQ